MLPEFTRCEHSLFLTAVTEIKVLHNTHLHFALVTCLLMNCIL